MTAEQFDNHAWRKSDKPQVKFEGEVCDVIAIDIEDNEVGIFTNGKFTWIHHSEIELVNKECCLPTGGFYLGTTFPNCNNPFRKDVSNS